MRDMRTSEASAGRSSESEHSERASTRTVWMARNTRGETTGPWADEKTAFGFDAIFSLFSMFFTFVSRRKLKLTLLTPCWHREPATNPLLFSLGSCCCKFFSSFLGQLDWGDQSWRNVLMSSTQTYTNLTQRSFPWRLSHKISSMRSGLLWRMNMNKRSRLKNNNSTRGNINNILLV